MNQRTNIPNSIIDTLMLWFNEHRRKLPWRGESDPYKIWVSEVMLQQTQVKTVIDYYHRWMDVFPNLQSLAAADQTIVLKVWEGLGYYARARNLQKGAYYLIEHHNGHFPATYPELLRIPGIGPYIAGAVASIAFNLPVAAVDGNVIRVVSRLIASDENADSTRIKISFKEILERSYYDHEPRWVNQAWMEFGALQCVVKPVCSVCPLSSRCSAYLTESVSRYPVKAMKSKVPHRHGAAFIFRRGDTILLLQRPPDGLLGGLWELPNVMLDEISIESFTMEMGIDVLREYPEQAAHQYSHFKVTFRLFDAILNRDWHHPFWVNIEWIPIAKLGELPRPQVHIKALRIAGMI